MMESFNMKFENEGTIGKAIVFSIIGMLIGMIPYLIIGGIMDWRMWYVGAISVGICVSAGWHFGNGKSGAIRQVTVIILSLIGAILTIQLGYAIAIYRIGIGVDFMAALDLTFDWMLEGIDIMFDNFGAIFDGYNLPAMIAWDTLLAAGVAIASAWRKFNFNTDTDLEDLENEDLEDLNMNTSSMNTGMDDLFNQDAPTLNMDQNWNCKKCGATNRSIVDSCEYCGENK